MAELCKTLKPAFSPYSWTLFLSILVGLLTVATQKTLSSLAQTHSISALSRFLNCYLPLAHVLAPQKAAAVYWRYAALAGPACPARRIPEALGD